MSAHAITPRWSVPWTLGDRLRKSREMSGYDAKAFAAALGISRDALRKYEHDVTTPKRPVLLSWALATGHTVDELLDHGDGPDAPAGQGNPPTSWDADPIVDLTSRFRRPMRSVRPHAA